LGREEAKEEGEDSRVKREVNLMEEGLAFGWRKERKDGGANQMAPKSWMRARKGLRMLPFAVAEWVPVKAAVCPLALLLRLP